MVRRRLKNNTGRWETRRASCAGRPAQPGTRRRGFTLVELLVVLAIIAVLVGLLLPTLGRVRANAQRVRCGSNLHNIGIAMMGYALEHDDHFPDRYTLTGVKPGDAYSVTLYRRAWGSIDPDRPAAGPEQLGLPALLGQEGYLADRLVWRCPAQSERISSFENTYNWTMDSAHETKKWYQLGGAKAPNKELAWDNTKYRPSVPNDPNSGVILLPAAQRFIPHRDAGGWFSSGVNAVNVLMTDGRVVIRQHK